MDGRISAFLTNLGRYNEGALIGEWVKLPVPEDQLQSVLDRIGINKQFEDRVIYAKNSIPTGMTPTVDMIRSFLEEPQRDPVIRFQNEIHINQTNLAYYDEKCGGWKVNELNR